MLVSVCYCYAIAKFVPKGIPRLLAFLPVHLLFPSLPLSIAFFISRIANFISWIANFKLLLLAFHKSPLSLPSPSLVQFLVLASLPVMTRRDSSVNQPHNSKRLLIISYAVKALLLAAAITAYRYTHYLHIKWLRLMLDGDPVSRGTSV
ncbi:probable long-chain-alcohol O-fatty-acyltransferase 1 [Neltuma alba]|uniref:probable long-chain-alcohol O-fatty-acyltransferase 1 n=1 Tax=Neltuma alba TaxID=207710 RepID=UPI0010A3D6A6|nr:probable long-chain-alcohol O-fatty-acyltransferase 1 [Prosopis alba]